jgi:hypothetical protein
VLDNNLTSDDYWLQSFPDACNNNPSFDMCGEYTKRTTATAQWSFDPWDSPTTLQYGEEMIKFDTPLTKVVKEDDTNERVHNDETNNQDNGTIVLDHDLIDDIINGIVDYSKTIKRHNRTIELLRGIYDADLGGDPPHNLMFEMFSCTQ